MGEPWKQLGVLPKLKKCFYVDGNQEGGLEAIDWDMWYLALEMTRWTLRQDRSFMSLAWRPLYQLITEGGPVGIEAGTSWGKTLDLNVAWDVCIEKGVVNPFQFL